MMQLAAIFTLLIYTLLLAGIGYYGFRTARGALIAFAILLGMVTIARQFIFLLGLDVPLPQSHFRPTEFKMMTIANLAAISWVVFVLIGYSAMRQAASVTSRLLPPGPSQLNPNDTYRGAFLPAALAIGFSIAGTLYLISSFGGLAQFLYAQKVGKEMKGLFVIKEAAALGAIFALVGFNAALQRLPGGRVYLSRQAFAFLGLIALAMAANYAWGNRYNIGLMIIILALTWHYRVKRLTLSRTLIWTLLALVFLQFLKAVRLDLKYEARGWEGEGTENFWLDLSTSMHFVEFDALMLALRDAGNLFDFRSGQDFANGLLSWIPRSIYADRGSFYIGPWFRQVYQPDVVNGWPVTVIGSWYINFAWIGIVIGGLLSGFFMRTIDAAYSQIRSKPWDASLGLGLSFFMVGAGINTDLPQGIVIFLVPLWIVSRILRVVPTFPTGSPIPPPSGSRPGMGPGRGVPVHRGGRR